MIRPHIVIAGGSGFIGQSLSQDCVSRGMQVVILSRSGAQGKAVDTGLADTGLADTEQADTEQAVISVFWDGQSLGSWQNWLEGASALINLTGHNVNCRHTPSNRELILRSRIDSVEVLEQALNDCKQPPPVWIQSGSLALYGSPPDTICDEESPALGDSFLSSVSHAWEQAFDSVSIVGVRKVMLRIGVVLGPGGGILKPLFKLTRFFLGGQVSHGRQYLSWIHVEDFNRLVHWVIENDSKCGAYNAIVPTAVTNAEFMKAIRRALQRPWSPPVPSLAVRFGARFILNTDAELAFESLRCRPQRLMDEQFNFDQPDLLKALRSCL